MKTAAKCWRLLTGAEKFKLVSFFSVRSLVNFLDLLGILLIGAVASAISGSTILPESSMGKLITSAENLGISSPLLFIAIAGCFFFIAKSGISILLNSKFNSFASKVQARIAELAFRKMLGADLYSLRVMSTTEITIGLTTSMFSFCFQTLSIANLLISEGLLVLLISAILILADPTLFVYLAFFLGIVAVLINFVVVRRIASSARDTQRNLLHSQEFVRSVQESLRQIVLSNTSSKLAKEFQTLSSRSVSDSSRLANSAALPKNLIELSLVILLGSVFAIKGVGGLDGLDGQILGIYLVGSLRLFSSFLVLQGAYNDAKALDFESGPARKLTELFSLGTIGDFKSRISTNGDLPNPVLRAKSLTLGHEKNSLISNLNFEFSFGDFIAIVGRSGSGKSTLADLITGVTRPIVRDSLTLGGLTPWEIRQSNSGFIAYVPQRVHLLNANILQNVSLNFEVSALEEQEIIFILKQVGLADLVSDPLAIGIPIGETGRKLSGGQIQKLGIARALYQRPKLLVLDEPTSSQDQKSQSEIVDLLRRRSKDMTLVVIAHRLETVQDADKFLVLNGGSYFVTSSFSEAKRAI